ncbi:hypothetical protein HMPREF9056_02769 [Actinomyces sp. oral taxon 170 str. F0386]|nr:hypothetical protein HMPREF9056_02769 [Actinomyces sp. oral taxon 170 str. F0386]
MLAAVAGSAAATDSVARPGLPPALRSAPAEPAGPRVDADVADAADVEAASPAGDSSGEAVPSRAPEYPARATVARRSSTLTVLGAVTRADSVARLTEALTPSSLFSFFSTRATQLAQVMPPMDRLTVRSCSPGSRVVGALM